MNYPNVGKQQQVFYLLEICVQKYVGGGNYETLNLFLKWVTLWKVIMCKIKKENNDVFVGAKESMLSHLLCMCLQAVLS